MRNQYMMSASNDTFLDKSFYGNRTCGLPDPDAFHIFRDALDGGKYTLACINIPLTYH